jgi:hypothetical protein
MDDKVEPYVEKRMSDILRDFAKEVRKETVATVLTDQVASVERGCVDLRKEIAFSRDRIERAQLTGSLATLELLATTWRKLLAELEQEVEA